MRTLSLVLFLACTACADPTAQQLAAPTPVSSQAPVASPAPPPPPIPKAPVAGAPATLAQMRAAVGGAACTASSQCATIAVGARPCGGPEAYFAYSSATTDAASLQGLAERYRAERKATHVASGMVSDCRLITNPGAQCMAGTCQLGSAATR
ncbi:hypothetical protein [Massilia glaciei]|uniref:DUF4189 domain-containing protein n=1 Tax=Massilia glaciei TaxID=1524097 RepID=A0A2U2HC48_9BURK|nr:hypothetical protein [Massilia glaciei]PWF40445.1 hypothetical protein C7C56_026075 [Massilia glaciei]